MNPLMFLKGAKIFVIVAALAYGLTVLKGCEDNRVMERDAAIVANANKVSAQANAANLAIANAQLAVVIKQRDDQQRNVEIAQEVAVSKFVEIEKLQQEQKSLLEGNRLNKAVRGKRTLIILRANKATRERFDEVEAIFNGT